MFGIAWQAWAAAGGLVLLAVLWEAGRQGGLATLWSYLSKRTVAPLPATATITDEQAFAAALLLARYRAASKGSAGYAAAMAAVKAALEVA